MKCAYPKYNKMTQLMQEHFDNRRFYCPIEDCVYSKNKDSTGLPHKEALNHLKNCEYRIKHCPKGCG